MVPVLKLEGAFASEDELRAMIRGRQVCFDHDPFYVRNADQRIVQIGFQLNLYAAFADPRQLPLGDDSEHRELLRDLQKLCRVFFQSLDLLKPCEHPEPPAHRIVYSPERGNRAEVCLQIPIFDRRHFGEPGGQGVEGLLAVAECLLRSVGARRGRWEENAGSQVMPAGPCEAQTAAAKSQARVGEGP
ncbi:MAG: hypothetical protein KF814_07605 [Nitrospiraceae bacterium]|nr:hypothetical protein [Nitrospiraceae bacterium]